MLRNIIGGIAVGIANIIPGVSGGTMMVILGIFQQAMEAFQQPAGRARSLCEQPFYRGTGR